MNHSLEKIWEGNAREKIASLSFPWVGNTDCFIICLNESKAKSSWAWDYEAGAVWHNFLLEAYALNLSANIIPNFDREKLRDFIEIEGMIPLFILQAGKENGVDKEKPYLEIIEPEEGFIYIFGRKIMKSSNTIIFGKMFARVDVEDDPLLVVEYKVNGKLIGEDYNMPYEIRLPISFKRCIFEVVAKDYFGNEEKKEMEFIKIG